MRLLAKVLIIIMGIMVVPTIGGFAKEGSLPTQLQNEDYAPDSYELSENDVPTSNMPIREVLNSILSRLVYLLQNYKHFHFNVEQKKIKNEWIIE